MPTASEKRRRGVMPCLAALQFCLAPIVVIGLVVAPPASGRMLLIPLTADAGRIMPRVAIDAGAALVGPGPVAGSLIVSATRNALFAPALMHRILVLGSDAAGCLSAQRA